MRGRMDTSSILLCTSLQKCTCPSAQAGGLLPLKSGIISSRGKPLPCVGESPPSVSRDPFANSYLK